MGGRETRRIVTVMSVDPVFSSEGATDVESPRPAVPAFERLWHSVASRYGGVVHEAPGLSRTAVFGATVIQDDDALRAVQAALVLRDDLAKEESGAAVGVGVSTGEVVTAPDGSITGAVTYRAKDLALAAGSNEVLIDRATQDIVAPYIESSVVTPDGSGEPSREVHRVLRIDVPEPEAAFPLVGRDRELSKIRQEIERAARSSSCRRLTVIGGPGAGKSRVIEEVRNSLDPTVRVLATNCRPLGEVSVFQPLAATLEQAAAIGAADPAVDVIAGLRALLSADDDAEVVIEQVSDLLGISEGPISLEGSFFGIRRVFEAVARAGPVVIVIEDVHWAPPTLLDALDALTARLSESPVFFLCSARLELLDERPEWAAATRTTSTITLDPLDSSEIRSMISQRLGGPLPDAVEEQIIETSNGNPFFAEEILASLIEGGVVEKGTEGPVFTGDVADVSLPRSVQTLIAQHLDALTNEERDVLEAAAVIGEVFDVASIERLAMPNTDKPVASLMKLSREGLVDVLPAARLGGDRFRFRHALVRETTYNAAPKETRAKLHEAHGTSLQISAGADTSNDEAIGFHFEQAALIHRELHTGYAHEEQLARGASSRLGDAGLRALERSDIPSALDLLRRAVALRELDGPDPMRLSLHLADALEESGELGEALSHLERTLAAAEAARETAIAGRAELELAVSTMRQEKITPEEAASIAEALIPVFYELDDDLGLCRAYQVIAESQWNDLRFGACERILDDALESARRAKSWRDEIYILAWLASASFWGPTPVPAAVSKLAELLEMSRGDRRVNAQVMLNAAGLEAMRKDFDNARKLGAKAKGILAELGLVVRLAGSTQQTGMAEMTAHDFLAAEKEFREGYDVLGALGDETLRTTSGMFLARALYAQGRYDEAEKLLERFWEEDDPVSMIDWAPTMAKILARRGDLVRAEKLGREAARHSQLTDAPRIKGDTLMDLGEVLLMTGKTREVRGLITDAIELYRQKGDLASEEFAQKRLVEVS